MTEEHTYWTSNRFCLTYTFCGCHSNNLSSLDQHFCSFELFLIDRKAFYTRFKFNCRYVDLTRFILYHSLAGGAECMLNSDPAVLNSLKRAISAATASCSLTLEMESVNGFLFELRLPSVDWGESLMMPSNWVKTPAGPLERCNDPLESCNLS